MKISRLVILGIGIFLTLSISNAFTSSEINQNSTAIDKTISQFKKCLEEKDISTFKRLIDKQGLIVIRNFNSGFGARGRDLRQLYTENSFPQNFVISVSNETPINILELGKEIVDTQDLPVIKLPEQQQFSFIDVYNPPTSQAIGTCYRILNQVKSNYNDKPVAISINSKEFVLIKSAIITDLVVGEWILFEKTGENYYIRTIFDIR